MGVGIKDVAKAAGVSPATVSRALGKGPVSEELRAQVEAAVRATGYRPNLAARRLRSQDSGTIGLVVADIRNPFFTAVSRAVEDSAYRAGVRVILCNTDEDPEREALYLRHMQSERITGLIFAPTRTTLDQLARRALDFPVVFIDRAGAGGLHDAVVLDNREAMGELVAHLVERGYRRIGGLFGNSSSHRRWSGAMAMSPRFRAASLTPDFRLVRALCRRRSQPSWRQLACASRDRPEAHGGQQQPVPEQRSTARRACALAWSIPNDLALAGFDNETWTELVEPGLTVIEQPVEEIGRAAMNLLFERLKTPTLPVRKVVLSGRCVLRGSTAARAS